ncbi:TetR/AcrR family transcriptional regulator C-terminal domain-containing protein [Streptomyces harbinensis]|uniref:TetR/AcrR family transcriptional regulator C-terminal domain-containing protein n=1 Tax=Streptomyces harbinensis TaxID=1176198 RepID=UPI003395A12D
MATGRKRGQRAGLTREAILLAALELADREGLPAVSMRRIAAALGVEAMTLYHHIPGKEALLDGMVEQLVARAQPHRPSSGTWQEHLRDLAHALRAALLAHPHLVPLLATRRATTARNLDAMENALRTLCAAGFTPPRALDVVYSLTGFVFGQVTLTLAAGSVGDPPGAEPDPAAHPLFHEAVRTGDPAPDARFEFALAALLAGFAAGHEPGPA